MRKLLKRVRMTFVIPSAWRVLITIALITAASAMLMSALLFKGLVDDQINYTFKSEAVCSRTNQGKPCQQLLTRLWTSMTDQQKLWVACGALYTLNDVRTKPIYARQCTK